MTTAADARERRAQLVRARGRALVEAASGEAGSTPVRDVIRASWRRSLRTVDDDLSSAPLSDEAATEEAWRSSPLQRAVGVLEEELRAVADDGDLVVAVTDPGARILWTCGGRVMRERAERVNFVAGGRWDEASVGTNALDLALRTAGPATVWSAEHYAPAVQGWVCWAAPVLDPHGVPLGVLDLSTTWERSHPLGLTTARAMAALLSHEVAAAARSGAGAPRPAGALRLSLLGAGRAELDGRPLHLTRRQLEVLAVLALSPDGLVADALHDAVYGDAPVSRSTLKAEVSHLRSLLGGAIGSRPYRLLLPCTSDVDVVRRRLRAGDPVGAADAWGGEVLAGAGGTDSPFLRRVDAELSAGLRDAVLATRDRRVALTYAATSGADPHVVRRVLGSPEAR
ncbi:transcriptional regulator [uncultured Pseudokineococcus sp.]|uniref:transcriptional regulator n=1 Tax=uncultured Pseudokineococcus sp. TaxID=1642928 RepID=UPI002612C49F|nr:transcriptional regulator [uncultured Pseudokineococcus sp.]